MAVVFLFQIRQYLRVLVGEIKKKLPGANYWQNLGATLKSLINEQTVINEKTGIVFKIHNEQTGINEYAVIFLEI